MKKVYCQTGRMKKGQCKPLSITVMLKSGNIFITRELVWNDFQVSIGRDVFIA